MQRTQNIKPSKVLTTILIIVCFFTASVFMYKSVIDKIIDNRESTVESFREEQFNVVWSSLEVLQMEAEKEVNEVSQKIEKDILSLSEEQLKKLEDDMNNDILNEDLHEILNSNISGESLNNIDNHMNGIVVMTIDGYIEDFNYYRASNSGSNIRDWSIAIENSYNKELEEDAIDKLLNRHSGIIALESYNLTKNENHIKINELTRDSLLNVFLEEGLNGLRNYQIFVPYYITDFGDIFGTPDIIHGTKLDNNKLIVVQEFNLYDQIVNKHYDLFSDNLIKGVNDRYDELLRLSYILGITLITSVMALILYLSNMYNNLVKDEEEEENTLINEMHDNDNNE